MTRIMLLLLLTLPLGCVVTTEPVAGEPGTPGKSGSDGQDGTDGMDGNQGKDGTDGAPGKDGAPGVSPFAYSDEAVMTDIYYSNGRVGIGTSAPSELLHVNGSAWFGSTDDTFDNPRLYIGRGVNPSEYGVVEYNYTAGDGQPVLELHLHDLGQLVLAANGNIGVGTLTPNASLDINGTTRLALNSSQPYACDAEHDGAIALTTKHRLCVCDGANWVTASDGLACLWQSEPTQTTFYAPNSIFRAASNASYNGDIHAQSPAEANGYSAAKVICSSQLGSASAHMCTTEEIARSAALGVTVPQGWYIGATYTYYSPNGHPVSDCSGFTTSSQTVMAFGWSGQPNIFPCSIALPVLCCDR